VESNIGLAHALGMTVVAEGAEREADTALLRSLACDEVQGYFYCRPVPSDELIAWKIKWESVHLRD
jgi:EAL domain-containing protein (putative c-di-GMP-specific phosphodiesterase class I)